MNELFKLLGNIKFFAYQTVVQFLISVLIPGTLTLLYFFPAKFDTLDIFRLIITIISAGGAFLVFTHILVILTIGVLKSINMLIFMTDDDIQEQSQKRLQASTYICQGVFFSVFLFYYIFEKHDFKQFLICYVTTGLVLPLMLLIFIVLKWLLGKRKKKEKTKTTFSDDSVNEPNKKKLSDLERKKLQNELLSMQGSVAAVRQLISYFNHEFGSRSTFQLGRTAAEKKAELDSIQSTLNNLLKIKNDYLAAIRRINIKLNQD